MLSFLLLLAGIIAVIIFWGKAFLLKIRLKHEVEMKRLEYLQKKEWEELVKEKMEVKRDEEWLKEKDELKKRVDELWEKRNETVPLDMKRIVLLHLILSGNKEGVTVENLEKEIDKVKKSYEMIKNYLN